MLRTEINGESLFDCKTSDFVGFTAAVVLLIGHGVSNSSSSSMPKSGDFQLLETAERVFQRLDKEMGCVIASQCGKALALLARATRDGILDQEIFIPYFGKINLRCAVEKGQVGTNVYDTNTSPPPIATDVTAAAASDAQNTWTDFHTSDLMDTNIFDLTLDSMWGIESSYEDGFMLPIGVDTASLDIDQDWSYIAQHMNS